MQSPTDSTITHAEIMVPLRAEHLSYRVDPGPGGWVVRDPAGGVFERAETFASALALAWDLMDAAGAADRAHAC
jgi:hypothetical protein